MCGGHSIGSTNDASVLGSKCHRAWSAFCIWFLRKTDASYISKHESHSFRSALPTKRLRFAACFFCQGSSLRSDKRKLRGLDSACGEAPGTARKGFVFCAAKCRCAKGKNPQTKGANMQTERAELYFQQGSS